MNVGRRTHRQRIVWGGLGVLLAGLLVWTTFGQVQLVSVLQILQRCQAAVLLALVPSLLVQCCDTLGWQLVLARLGRPLRHADVFWAQVVSEAAMIGLPLGFLVSEPLRPYLLRKLGGVDVPTGVGATAVRKYLLMSAEAVVMALALALGFSFLQQYSRALIGFKGLGWLALALVLVLIALAQLLGQSVGSGHLAQHSLSLFARLVPRAVRARITPIQPQFDAVDDGCARAFAACRGRSLAPLGCYVLVWLLEAVETYTILRLVGVELPFPLVLVAESLLSFLRSVIVILPAGLGVQDLGYVLFLRVLGVPDALEAGAAFALIKRSKEALWVLLGLGALYQIRGQAPASALALGSRALDQAEGSPGGSEAWLAVGRGSP